MFILLSSIRCAILPKTAEPQTKTPPLFPIATECTFPESIARGHLELFKPIALVGFDSISLFTSEGRTDSYPSRF